MIKKLFAALALAAAAAGAQTPIAQGNSAGAALDSATIARVVDGATARLNEHYVFPDVAKRMGDFVRARAIRGEYNGLTGAQLASRLTADFREVSRDRHLGMSYSNRVLPPERGDAPDSAALAQMRQYMLSMNCGFVQHEVGVDNVGYLKFNMFGDVEVCGPIASRAMNALANADNLIIDLRENGGGHPAMVAYVSSYLFGGRTHLNDLWTRRTNHTEEYWTRDVPGEKYGETKPVYVLTSARTFSGAEEFTYNLKNLKRATIIGETTGGGAHPTRPYRIDDHFMIGVPFARAINPISKTNWEGTGVKPDVAVPAADALTVARRMISEKQRIP